VVWKRQRGRGHRGGGIDTGLGNGRAVPALVADGGAPGGLRTIPTSRPGSPAYRQAVDLVGTAPNGEPVTVSMGAPGDATLDAEAAARLLVIFLSVDCEGCQVFWRGLRDLEALGFPVGVAAAVVTKGPQAVAPERVARCSEGIDGIPVVMSDQAWVEFGVHGYPHVLVVDRSSSTVTGEVVPLGWDDARALLGPG